MDRQPKPLLPVRQKRNNDPRWQKESVKEQQKLLDEEVFRELPKDTNGDYIMPEGCMMLRLFEIPEFKWKVQTKPYGWSVLEL